MNSAVSLAIHIFLSFHNLLLQNHGRGPALSFDSYAPASRIMN